MNPVLIAALTAAVLCTLGGCATKSEPAARYDWRTGTDATPYRTIPALIQCDDCRYAPER